MFYKNEFTVLTAKQCIFKLECHVRCLVPVCIYTYVCSARVRSLLSSCLSKRVLHQLSIKKAENLAKCSAWNYKNNMQVVLSLTNTQRAHP